MSDPVVQALRDEHADLAALLDGLDDDDWRRQSRCPGWPVSDVVLHLSQTDERARASLEGDEEAFVGGLTGAEQAANVDELVELMVSRERGEPPSAVLRRWTDASRRLDDAFDAIDVHQRVPWVSGELSARTLAATRISEAWIHHGDIAAAVGAEQKPTDRLQYIARLAWRTVPYAFARQGRELHGPVAFELTSPSGEPWSFTPDEPAATTVQGPALDACLVAARRADPADTALIADGPDAAAVLELMRTYA